MDLETYAILNTKIKKITDALASGMKYKGSVELKSDLPLTGNKLGDCYTVKEDGAEYVWSIEATSGTIDNWEQLSGPTHVILTLDADAATKQIKDLSGNVLTFSDIYSFISDKTKSVVLIVSDCVACYPATYDGTAIEFTNTYKRDGDTYADRAIINSDNEVLWEEEAMAAKADLDDYAKLGKITITMVGSAGNIPTGDKALVYEVFPDGTERLISSTVYGSESITVKVDDEVTYKVTGSTDIDNFYLPTSTIVDLVKEATVTVTYTEIAKPVTLDDVHNLIALGVEESVMSIGDEINIEWTATNGTKYTAPAIVMDLGQSYKKHSDGTSVKGVRFQFKYGFPDAPQFDAAEREIAEESTALADTYYYGTNDNSTFVLLDYTEGQTIDKSAYTYIYHNSFKDTSYNILKYGNNLLEYSAELQWLNSNQAVGKWWSSTHTGDTAPSQATTINGFIYGFGTASWLSYVLDEDFTVSQNTITTTGSMKALHGKFRNPMLVEMYGSPQVTGEGDNKYWEGWKILCNNSETNPITSPGNGNCGARRIRNLENSSFSPSWLSSPARGNSCSVWCSSSGIGSLNDYGAIYAIRCAPAFVIF